MNLRFFKSGNSVFMLLLFIFSAAACSKINTKDISSSKSATILKSEKVKPSCCSAKPSRFNSALKAGDRFN